MSDNSLIRKGKRIVSQSRQIILSVREYFLNEKISQQPNPSYRKVNERVCLATRISERSLARIVKETPILSPKRRERRKKINPTACDIGILRSTIVDLYKNRVPSIDLILKAVNDQNKFSFGQIKRDSLYKFMKAIGFKYQRTDKIARSILMEKPEIVSKRRSYLRYLNHLREIMSEAKVIYLDETWIDSRCFTNRMWSTSDPEFEPRLGGGKRYIIIHAGSESGFIPNCLKMFTVTEIDGDYHKSMNSKVFKDWFINQLLVNIPENSIIIMDNAPYHSLLLDKPPNTASRIAVIKEWLTKNNIIFSDDMIKSELLALVKQNSKKTYEIDEIATKAGHKIVRLPPYYCELNPIELIWSEVKGYVSKKNVTGASDISDLIRESFDRIESELWANCCLHVKKIEKQYWEVDYYIDSIVEEMENLNIDSIEEERIEVDESESETEFEFDWIDLPEIDDLTT